MYAKQVEALHNAIIRQQPDLITSQIKQARHNEFPPKDRLSVYANGYLIRLVEATITDYPALEHYMGHDSLEAIIRTYAKATPSRFWDLNLYPLALPDFIKSHSNDARAYALARLESAITQVFWAEESTPLTAVDLSGFDEELLGRTIFTLRHAARLLALDKAANAYLTAFRADAPLDAMSDETEYLLVIRHDNQVKRHILDPEEYQLLSNLATGKNFNDALADMQSDTLEQKLPHYLTSWLENGVFSTFSA